jgi:beta-phosphoglucomutase-like phosphatase (HAD superfamily)
MIKGLFFDLDGTLVQTEKVKALSYAKAAVKIAPTQLSEKEVMIAFTEVVGRSRIEVAKTLISNLRIEESSLKQAKKMHIAEGWQALLELRLHYYQEMISDPTLVQTYACPFNIGLLRWSCDNGYKTGLATMSYWDQTQKIVEILDISRLLDVIATRDDVKNGKPDPEIYLRLASILKLNPGDCLVIEDSTVGIQAALKAGMNCIAVTNELTKKSVHECHLLDPASIIDDLEKLQTTVEDFIRQNSG